MSTPDRTAETSDHGADARAKQDKLTESIRTRLTVPDAKAPWWKRLLGRG